MEIGGDILATTKQIIDWMLRGVGISQEELDSPDESIMSREYALSLINELRKGPIAEAIGNIKSAALVITDGIATLPSDWVKPHRVYDGDAPDQEPLEQIFDIEDKVADDDATSQYMLPDNSTMWIFGKTPEYGIKAYYIYFPESDLTDDNNSSPVELKAKFHRDIFVAYARKIDAINNNDPDTEAEQGALVEALLKEIKMEYSIGKRDEAIQKIDVEW